MHTIQTYSRILHRSDQTGSPYSLAIVSHDRIKGREHFSISSTGVCRLAPGHGVSFVPAGVYHCKRHHPHCDKYSCEPPQAPIHLAVSAGTWLREHSLFDLLSAKRISKTWLLAKLFRIWCQYTRRSHFAKMQRSFAAQSFLAKPLFCKAMLQLRNIIHDMVKVQLLDVQPGKARHLEVFST